MAGQKTARPFPALWLEEGEFSTTLPLGRTKVTEVAVYRSGFTIHGSMVLEKL